MSELGFTTDDGLRIVYYLWPEEPARIDVPPVVVHHGFLADARTNWVEPGIVAALVASGRRVVGVDARGHGRSDKPHDSASYGEQRMAADLSQLADHLGLSAYDLIGYSMGAVVALIAASTDPRVRRLAVGGIGSGVLRRGGVDSRRLALDAVVEALLTDDPASIADPTAKQFREFAEAMGNDLQAVAALARAAFQSSIALDQISADTLVYVGDADEMAYKPEQLSGAITGARLEILTGNHLSVLGDPRLAPLLATHAGSP
jgi:pimeloyl-ACP methyl ester carboxylesterase